MLFLEDCVAGNIYICYHKIEDNLYLHKYLGDDKWSVGTITNKTSTLWNSSLYEVLRLFNSNGKVIPLYKINPLEEGMPNVPLKEVLQNLDLIALDALQAAKTYSKLMLLPAEPNNDIINTFLSAPTLRREYLYKDVSPELKTKIIARLDKYLSNDDVSGPFIPVRKIKTTKKYKIINCTKDKQLFRELNE